ncbi:parallel beta-helix repeat protein [Vibrio phage 2.275.O._10N.286.54.E11]|nr:parallel beta-helix repeat protein [Vibrio phage 2.275.O._10N.286.54.E11]
MAQQLTGFFGRNANLEPKVLQSEKDILSAAFGQTSVDAWEANVSVTSPEDLRLYNHKVYYAPQSHISPVVMDATGPTSPEWQQVQDFTFETVEVLQKFSLEPGVRVTTKGYTTARDSNGITAIVVEDTATDRGFTLPNGNVAVPYWDTIQEISSLDVQMWLSDETFARGQIRYYEGVPYIAKEGTSPTTYPVSPDGDFEVWSISAVSASSQRDDGEVQPTDTLDQIDPPLLGAFDSCFVSINGVVQHESSYTVNAGVIEFGSDVLNVGDLWTVIVNNSYGAATVMQPKVAPSQIADGVTSSFDTGTTSQLAAEAYSVYIDGVHQVPNSDFTVQSNKIIFDEVPIVDSKIDVTAYQPVLDPLLGDVGTGSVTANGVSKSLQQWITNGEDINALSTGSTHARSLGDRFSDVVNVVDFGAIPDGSTNSTSAIQAAIDYAATVKKPVYLPDGTIGSGAYLTDDVLTIPSGMHMFGNSSRSTTIICLGNHGIVLEAGAKGCLIENLTIYSNQLHTISPNTYIGISVPGTTGNRPYYNVFRNVFIDGFSRSIVTEWAWATQITGCNMNRTGKGLHALHQGVNNFITNCTMGGDNTSTTSQGIHIHGDAAASEGWIINGNLIDAFGRGIELDSSSHNYIESNILDHCEQAGIVMSNNSINQSIQGNYIGMDDGTGTCIQCSNSSLHFQQDGHSIIGNTLVPYNNINYGITLDVGDAYTRVIGNSVRSGATQAAVRTFNSPINVIIQGNNFSGQDSNIGSTGTSLETKVLFKDNIGDIINSEIVLRDKIGQRDVIFDNSAPSTGTWKRGDIVYTVSIGTFTNIGWVCTDAGSPGTWQAFGALI